LVVIYIGIYIIYIIRIFLFLYIYRKQSLHCTLALSAGIAVLERDLEARLVRKAQTLGGVAFKFVSPGNAGVPDRLVLLPVPPEHRAIVGRYVCLIELKAPGCVPNALQRWQIDRINRLGHRAQCVDSVRGLDALLA